MSKKKKALGLIHRGRDFLQSGRLEDALSCANNALKTLPNDASARELLADCAYHAGDYGQVISLLQSILKNNPYNHVIHNKIAVAYALSYEFQKSLHHLQQSERLNTGHLPTYLDMCRVATELGEHALAIQAGEKAVKLAPHEAKARDRLASAYEVYGYYEQAREHYRVAAELSPDNGLRHYAYAMSLQGIDERQLAEELLEKSIALLPKYAPAYYAVARMKKYDSPEHADFAKIHSLLVEPGLTDNNRSVLYFALGKMYEDCKMYETAFEYFMKGNAIENTKWGYRPDSHRRLVTRLIDAFSYELVNDMKEKGHPSHIPLFVVGMPRSGTTLVEQILACHKDVFGAGELPWFIKCAQDLSTTIGSKDPYPECVTELTGDTANQLGNTYLQYLRSLTPYDEHYAYIINKWPNNYERIGLIASLFPNARFIHCRRDAMDNLISQYTLLFPNSVEYSYDLYNLGAHYAQYMRLMDHWHHAMPGRILDIRYEDLVDDLETGTRKMLEFLELPWDDACLDFHKSRRTVRTYSDSQVRRPIYKSSIGRWYKYEKFLEPLRQGLASKE